MPSSPDLFKQLVAMRKEGRVNAALALLRDALNRGRLGPEEIDRAGRFIQKARPTRRTPRGRSASTCSASAPRAGCSRR